MLFALAACIFGLVLFPFLASWQAVLTDAAVSSFFLCLGIGTGIIVVSAYPTKVGILAYALLTGIVAGFLSWYGHKLFLQWHFYEKQDYNAHFLKFQWIRLLVFCLISGWIITITAFSRKKQVLEKELKIIGDAASLRKEAELFKLRQQLQPHFLYNSLNSINALILIQPEKAQEMIGRLSDFLRNSVKSEGREQIPVQEELEYIENYLSIETIRFGERLKVNYRKHFTGYALLPPFLLQPVLENAIKFGLYGTSDVVEIEIEIGLDDGFLNLSISNPFDPENKPPAGTGFGLESIRRRLYLLYGRTDLLKTGTEGNLFFAFLKIPQQYV